MLCSVKESHKSLAIVDTGRSGGELVYFSREDGVLYKHCDSCHAIEHSYWITFHSYWLCVFFVSFSQKSFCSTYVCQLNARLS